VSVALQWLQGGRAELLSLTADAVVVRSSVAWPPGSRVQAVRVGDESTKLSMKVHACRREAEEEYRIEGRPVDMTRDVREQLGRSLTD
jgi:hypothetical protein